LLAFRFYLPSFIAHPGFTEMRPSWSGQSMKRRQFISLIAGAATWPLGARAQTSLKTPRVAILSTANPRSSSFFQAFERRLRDLGYIEGQNIAFEYRNAGGEIDKLPGIAAELVSLDVDVIVTSTDVATRAAKDATSRIPILMVAINYDPIALGYIDSIARPGANVTGLYFQHLELLAKRLGLFKEMLPGVKRVAVLYDALAADQLKQVSSSNQSVGFDLQLISLENPPYDFENAFRIAVRSGAEALFVLETASIFRGRVQITRLASENRLPTSFAFREYVEVGGLTSYGVNFSTMYRRAAEYTDKLLRGAKPADLPVEQSTKFELVINLKTAKALGITVPMTLQASADEVVE
jgi:putative tryptophan/tyrosine transport system substrate-binding protein